MPVHPARCRARVRSVAAGVPLTGSGHGHGNGSDCRSAALSGTYTSTLGAAMGRRGEFYKEGGEAGERGDLYPTPRCSLCSNDWLHMLPFPSASMDVCGGQKGEILQRERRGRREGGFISHPSLFSFFK